MITHDIYWLVVWIIFFRRVETTNQLGFYSDLIYLVVNGGRDWERLGYQYSRTIPYEQWGAEEIL